jgi:hypothetical protein
LTVSVWETKRCEAAPPSKAAAAAVAMATSNRPARTLVRDLGRDLDMVVFLELDGWPARGTDRGPAGRTVDQNL